MYFSSAENCYADVSENTTEIMFRIVKSTSSGWGGLPSWPFRNCSVELAHVVTHLINFIINDGQIPDIWRTAIVTPILKVAQPFGCGDYRPMSVTPIL